jgi:hypothetical protein
MVQGLPQTKRVYQGLAFPVFVTQPLHVFAFDLERRYSSHAVLYADSGKVPALGEKKRSDEDVCRFKTRSLHLPSPPFPQNFY